MERKKGREIGDKQGERKRVGNNPWRSLCTLLSILVDVKRELVCVHNINSANKETPPLHPVLEIQLHES